MNGLQKMALNLAINQAVKMLVDYIRKTGSAEFKQKVYELIDKGTDLTPWQFDDKYVDPLAKSILSNGEFDEGVVTVLDGLINLIRAQMAEGLLQDAALKVVVEVKKAFTADIPELPAGA